MMRAGAVVPQHAVRRRHVSEEGDELLPVEEGRPAPDFTLTSDTGEDVTLSAYRGKSVVLYFYPKDEHARLYRAGMRDPRRVARVRAEWRGRPRGEPGQPKSHVRFREKYGLPFSLLADEDHAVSEAYGVWVEKSFAGKKYMGVERSTFVIGPDGTLEKVRRRVKPDTHADEVLAALSG